MNRLMAVLMVLGACSPQVPDSGATPGDVADAVPIAEELAPCGGGEVQDLIGQPVSGLRDRFPDGTRIIPAGGLIAQEYSPKRMNVDLDGAGGIARIWCG